MIHIYHRRRLAMQHLSQLSTSRAATSIDTLHQPTALTLSRRLDTCPRTRDPLRLRCRTRASRSNRRGHGYGCGCGHGYDYDGDRDCDHDENDLDRDGHRAHNYHVSLHHRDEPDQALEGSSSSEVLWCVYVDSTSGDLGLAVRMEG